MESFFIALLIHFLAADNKSFTMNVLIVLGTILKVQILPILTILIFSIFFVWLECRPSFLRKINNCILI